MNRSTRREERRWHPDPPLDFDEALALTSPAARKLWGGVSSSSTLTPNFSLLHPSPTHTHMYVFPQRLVDQHLPCNNGRAIL